MPKETSKFKESYVEDAEELALEGFTDQDLAEYFHVTKQTINNWKKNYPLFFDSLKRGKDIADRKVIRALFHRAIGYSSPDVHVSNYQGDITITPIIKHYPPDPASCFGWLYNRQPEQWRQKREIDFNANELEEHLKNLVDAIRESDTKTD